MKFTIPRIELEKAVQQVGRAIASRSHSPILEGIHLEAKDQNIILTGSSLDMSLELTVPALVEEKGSLVVNARLFSDIIRSLPEAAVSIDVKDHQMSLVCAQSQFQLVGYDGAEYPPLPYVEEEYQFTLPAAILRKSIRQTVFATAQDTFRPVFTGVLFRVEEDHMDVVALDGYRLAKRYIGYGAKEPMHAVVPGRSLQELARILEGVSDDVTLRFSDSQLCISMPHMDFYSILLEGEFFHYEEIVRQSHPITLEVNRKQIQEAVERASLLAREDKANLIKLQIQSGTMVITSRSEVGAVTESLPLDYTGDELVIAFNSRYLLDGLRNLEEDTILLHFADSLSPLIMEGIEDQDYLYLVLPVRLAKEV